VCFQKPTSEAYDLAKDAWKAGREFGQGDTVMVQSEWISVETSLPEYDQLVSILINREEPTVGQRDSNHGDCWRIGNDCISWDYDFSFGVEMDVTHWQPLPTPPTNEDK